MHTQDHTSKILGTQQVGMAMPQRIGVAEFNGLEWPKHLGAEQDPNPYLDCREVELSSFFNFFGISSTRKLEQERKHGVTLLGVPDPSTTPFCGLPPEINAVAFEQAYFFVVCMTWL
jgi:hypothetical protein